MKKIISLVILMLTITACSKKKGNSDAMTNYLNGAPCGELVINDLHDIINKCKSAHDSDCVETNGLSFLEKYPEINCSAIKKDTKENVVISEGNLYSIISFYFFLSETKQDYIHNQGMVLTESEIRSYTVVLNAEAGAALDAAADAVEADERSTELDQHVHFAPRPPYPGDSGSGAPKATANKLSDTESPPLCDASKVIEHNRALVACKKTDDRLRLIDCGEYMKALQDCAEYIAPFKFESIIAYKCKEAGTNKVISSVDFLSYNYVDLISHVNDLICE